MLWMEKACAWRMREWAYNEDVYTKNSPKGEICFLGGIRECRFY